MSKNSIDINQKFYIFDNFLISNKHILQKGNEAYDSSKIFYQLSMEHADSSPLSISAEEFQDSCECLINSNRDKNIFLNPVVVKDESFSDVDVAKVYDDNYVIIAMSGVLQLINPQTLEVVDSFILNSSEYSIVKMEITCSHIVLLDYDWTLTTVDKNSKELKSASNVDDFFLVDDEKNVAVIKDKTLHIYSLDTLEKKQKFKGHKESIKGVIYTPTSYITWTAQEVKGTGYF